VSKNGPDGSFWIAEAFEPAFGLVIDLRQVEVWQSALSSRAKSIA